jgi:serine/threonine-protein kinase
MSDIEPGTLVDGRYKVLHRLGSGGMADVFCAEDQQLGRNVALKLLHRRFAEDPGFVERFRREAQSAAGLQHPNVVSVYDRGSFGGTYYIAMEYLPGRSLKRLIRDEAPLDPVRAIDLTIQILKAARFAHRRGVIHRDLKPHNVMVDEADHAKVTDFGIARAGASDMTETGSIMGTAQYLSPEQAQGMAVSESSDLYSVGVVLYEMLTGRVPFDAESAVTIALKHVSAPPTPPTQLNPAVPQELEQIVLWSMNKDPAHRPVDADQLIAALMHAREAIVSGGRGQRTADMAALAFAAGVVDPVEPHTSIQPAAAPGAAPVTPGAAASAYAAPAALGAGPRSPEPANTGHWIADGQGTRDGAPPYDERERRPVWPWWVLAVLIVAAAGVATYFLTRPSKRAVPAVVNEIVAVAQAQLQNDGFTPNLIYRSDTATKDLVIGQFPLAGTRAKTGSTVTLTVSTGPGSVTVPSVQDLPRADAVKSIKDVGLKVDRTQSQSSATVAAGSAINTDPPAGTSLAAGSKVTLFVSSGPAPVNVPNLTGLSKTDAESRLSALNLNFSTVSQPSSTAPVDTVISQSATGNVPPGTTIELVIATAPTTATVPGVTGKKAADAIAALTAAGFTSSQTTKKVTDSKKDGVVLSQSPAANAIAQKNSTVKLVVGQYKATTTTPTTPTATTTTPTTTTTTTTTTTKP